MKHPAYCTCAQCSKKRLERSGQTNPKSKATRQGRAERYLNALSKCLGINVPLLLFSDELRNAGACGEAGQSTIWLQTEAVKSKPWKGVKEVIRRELAHIVVHRTPGMGDVPVHGKVFAATLRNLTYRTRSIDAGSDSRLPKRWRGR